MFSQHLTGKKYFCKLDCSQAYHCKQMADGQSVQMLFFNLGSRTFASKRLAQGLNRRLSAFSILVREYLDPVVKADRCTQHVDDIGVADQTASELINSLDKCFLTTQIKKTGSKCPLRSSSLVNSRLNF